MSTPARVNVAPSIWQWLLTIGAELPSRDMEKVAEWRSPNAEKTPTINQLKELSGRLHVPFGYFLLRTPIDDTPPIFAFRTVKGKGVEHPSRELIDTVAQMSQIQEWARDDAERNRLEKLSFIGSAKVESPVETVVSDIRKTLGLKSNWFEDDTIQGTRVSKKQRNQAAFTFLRERCAGSGIFVFTTGIAGQSTRRKLDPDEFRAFALIDDYAPLIFINHNDSSAARLFSLAHELVHLWLGKSELYNAPYLMNSSTTKMEAYCNKVASEILIPDEIFLQQWASDKADGLQELEKLAEYFCASPLAIARRALDHGFIGQQDYDRVAAEQQERWGQVSRERASAGGGDFYRTNLSRTDSRFLERLASSVAEGRTTYSQASHLMGMKWTTLAELITKAGL